MNNPSTSLPKFVSPSSRVGCAPRVHDLGSGSVRRVAASPFRLLALICLALVLVALSAKADWPNTNATKFVQLPDISTNGMDIDFGNVPTILADDFVCTNTGPISDIHLWVSSIANAPATGAQIQLSIWEDVPAGPLGPSHPGRRLWFENFFPGDYQVVLAATGLTEQFWKLDPLPAQFLGYESNLFLYNFFPKLPYYQTGSSAAPVIYWLGVTFLNNQPPQGWKTTTNHLAPDAAVLGHINAVGDVTDWRTLLDPRNPNSRLDFAFALTTLKPANPPVQCVETNGVKYLQPPKIDGGYDVWDNGPWVLADDFICTTTGPITDIHIWGSWLQDRVQTNLSFWIGIYDDVPSITNGTVIIPSRPGTNLLWQQWFNPGDYSSQLWGTGIEYFLDPGPPALMGPDSQAYYYCFYPTNPLVQQGAPNQPKIYWLAVYAKSPVPTAEPFGWKTTFNRRFDISVHTPWPGAAPITTAWDPTYDLNFTPLDLAFKLTTSTNQPPPQDCIENKVKYEQPPKVDGGYDVWDNGPWVLADDFICTNTGPVTDIHIWGSWLQDRAQTNLSFWIGIYDDVPAIAGSPSRPGTNLLWQQWFAPGEYAHRVWGTGVEYFLDPGPPAIMGPDSVAHYYCFYPTNPFVQLGTLTQPRIYWLAVHAVSPTGFGEPFGWKSTFERTFDISVHTDWPGAAPITTDWKPTIDPNNIPLDLAFKITTSTNEPPPQQCVEQQVKYVQWPDRQAGFDVWDNGPWVLADDFICTNTGPVTDIHIWGSWLKDQPTTNLNFWIGIYDDVPALPTSPSHPGNLKWQQWFGPGQYVRTLDGSGIEQFLDPGPPSIMGPDSNIWYYCFYPTNAFIQEGTLNAPKIYWLVVHSDTPPGSGEQFGWKSTMQRRFDISVHGPWPGGPPPAAFPWTPTIDVTGRELDLAFKVTTRTSNCPFSVECPTNKVVDCGATWTFDSPKVVSPCCGTNITVTSSTVTNGFCPQLITRTWLITDCLGNAATCTQTITVVSTVPTVVICATNKVVECGTTWAPDPPTVVPSPCCGTNYSVFLSGAVTNGGLCDRFIAFAWTVIDCCGKTNSCTQLVTVKDTTPPVVNCPTNKVVECGTSWSFDTPTALDACCGTNVTVLPLITATNGKCPQVITRTWAILDCCTNRINCSQDIRVVDTTPPVVLCPSNMVVKTCGTNVLVTWTNLAYDLCSGVTVGSSPPPGTYFLPNTTNVVTVFAKDDCGNTNACSFLVAVVRPALSSLSISLSGTTLTLSWTDGILQQASTVIGPWTDVPGATPPAYSTSILGPMKFYRLRCNSP